MYDRLKRSADAHAYALNEVGEVCICWGKEERSCWVGGARL